MTNTYDYNGVEWDFATLNNGFDGRLKQEHEHQIPFLCQFEDPADWDMLDKFIDEVMEDYMKDYIEFDL